MVQNKSMNSTLATKTPPSVVRIDKSLADRVRSSVECDLEVPVSISNAVTVALREYLDRLSDLEEHIRRERAEEKGRK